MFPNGYSWNQPYFGEPQKVFQDVGFIYTWIDGDDDVPNDVDINDIEVHGSLVLIPNFLNSTQPLFITPGFILSLWNGPRPPNPADLPSKAYAAYVRASWRTNPELILGADVNFQVGIHTDFDTLVTDSIRYQGQGLGLLRVTPTLTAEFGVRYLDRAKIKLLPAFGVLWQPSPTVKFDIFFPQPKLSIFLSTIAGAQVWGYVGAEYGGGSWTIEQAYGVERVDINDIRVFGGIEFFGPRGLNGFIEGGYVFEREVIYVVQPGLSFDAPDTFMLRAGLSF